MPDKCVVSDCVGGYESDRKYRRENGLPQLSLFKAPKVINAEHHICEEDTAM